MLSFKDQQRVRYVKRHVTGLSFRPSPLEYQLQNNNILGQDRVASFVEQLWKTYKTPECNTVAYKGGTLEFVLLTLLSIPSLDLEKEGCPTFNKLRVDSTFPKCPCHTHSNVHSCQNVMFFQNGLSIKSHLSKMISSENVVPVPESGLISLNHLPLK